MNILRIKVIIVVFIFVVLNALSQRNAFGQCVTAISNDELLFQSSGDYSYISVTVAEWCGDSWDVYASESWISVWVDYAYDMVLIAAEINEDCGEYRHGIVSIGELTVDVTQDGYRDVPPEPGSISGPNRVCSNTPEWYSLAEVPGAISYDWSTNDGVVISGQGSRNAEIIFSTIGSHVVSVTALNECIYSPPSQLIVEVILGPSPSLENQDTIRLGACPILSGTQNIAARDEIILMPGFSFTATTSTSFTGRIDHEIVSGVEYLTEPPNPETRTINPDYLVGTTNGSINVNPMGGASYTIPLELLPGINGLSPNLSIIYSSNPGASTVGYGWQISGLSEISRGPQTIYNDGTSKGIELDINDRFYLDGQRLVNTSYTYGDANAQYQTENDIFTRVTPQGTDANGPAWFKAETKSGLIFEYGNSTGSKQQISGFQQVLNWHVSKVRDLSGNEINITYTKDHNNVFPSEMSYGPNTISFYYTDREDKVSTYLKGVKMEQHLLLDKITVKYNSTVVKEYKFRYSYSGSLYNSFSILNEVEEYGVSSSRLNSTALSYQIPDDVSFQGSNLNTHQFVNNSSKLYPGDFNGDGKSDILCLPDASKGATWTGIRVCLSDGNDNFSTSLSSSTIISDLRDIRALDINGDGKEDILYEVGSSSTSAFYYILCDGSSLSEPVLIDTQTYGVNTGMSNKLQRTERGQVDDNEQIRRDRPSTLSRSIQATNIWLSPADYNGDGVNDIFINQPNGDWVIKSFVNPQGELESSLCTLGFGRIETLGNMVISGDFNGDGKSDLWCLDNNGLNIYSFSNFTLNLLYTNSFPRNDNYLRLGDFNADGKIDIFLYGTYNGYDWPYYYMLLSTGTAFETIYIPQKKSNLQADNVRVGDFNGDGATDLIVTSPDQSWNGINVFISVDNGSDFYVHNIPAYPISSQNLSLGDFNGDGHTDYICTSYLFPVYQVHKTIGNTSILLDEVSNGLGLLTKLTYTKLSQASLVYQRGTGASYPVTEFQGSWNVVSSVEVDDGIGSTNTQNYYYEGGKIHLQGKGFLGFTKIRTVDVTAGIEHESISGYNTTYFYPKLLEISTKRAGTTDIIETTTNNWSQVVLDATRKRIMPYVESSTHTNVLTGQSVTSSAAYGEYGSPTSMTKSYNNGVSETNTNTYENLVSSTQWLLGRPTATTIQFADNATTITRSGTRVFSQNSNNLENETWYSGTNNQVTNAFSYNTNGTFQSKTVTANGISRSTSMTYESDNIRIHTSTDQLSHVKTNAYDRYGRLQAQQDYLGNSVTYQYDDFGRQNSSSTTDGNQATTVYAWEDPTSEPSLARYSVLKTGNDGSQTKIWYDILGRAIRSEVKGFDGTMIYTSTEYNEKGQVLSISDPYYSADTHSSTTFIYDLYGRKTNQNHPSGRNSTWQYSTNTTTETTAGKSFSKTYSSDGTLASATDAGGTIAYTYYPDGKVKTITAPGGITTTMQYDIAGNQTQLVDPSAGTSTYAYNGFGELTSQINAKNETTSMVYNSDGRVSERTSTEGTTSYTYNANKQLTSVSSPGSVSRTFTYNTKGRIIANTETIPGSSAFTTYFTFDDLGRISTITHPSGITETNTYNLYGYLSSISSGGSVRWTTVGINARQQVTSGLYGGNLNTSFGYDAYGFPTSTTTGTIQNYSYNFNPVTGNLNWRQNNKFTGLREDFHYDNLNRLDSICMGSTMTLDMAYDSNKGGITTKSDVGTLVYNTPGKPYAVSNIDPSTGLTPFSPQSFTYTSFESVSTIAEDDYTALFTYNSNNERAKMEVQLDGNAILTRWYPDGDYIKETAGSLTKEYTFIGGDAYSAPVVAITQSSTTTYYNILRDYLGNITHIVNASSNSLVEEYSFDAWGRMRNPTTWENYEPGSEPVLFICGRGYTGHEHLPWFNLINMNGRVYDPLIGGFISPDNYVQSPDFSQNFNRYTYCLNNPLVYTDPSGEFIFTIIGALLAPVTGGASLALGIAMDVGGAINLGSKALQGKIHNFGDGVAAYGIGAAAGAVGYATGGAAFAVAGGAAGGAGGFLAGCSGGALGTAYSMPILSAGNSAYFGDPMMTPGQYAAGILTGGLLGGGINGGVALLKGRTFWTGTTKPVPSNWQSPPLDTYHSGYQNPSEIKIPEKLSYYTPDDPSTWTTIGTVTDEPIYFTPNSELSKVGALNDLALPKMPNFRVDMTSPNLLDPNKIMIIRRVTGNVFRQGGGGWEIMYRGPLDLNQVKVVITILP